MAHVEGTLYVANTDSLMRYPYTPGQTRLDVRGEKILDLPAGGYNNHWTRNVVVRPDGGKVYVSVGSATNVDEEGIDAKDQRRAERDGLGDDLVPDYLTRVRDGGFYGWPYAYFGRNEDPRHKGQRPELVATTTVPDYPLGAPTASLSLVLYNRTDSPAVAGSRLAHAALKVAAAVH